MGLPNPPHRETCVRDFGLYPWWAFCIKNLFRAKNKIMKKSINEIGIGLVILLISIFASDWSHISDWSTPELVGFNLMGVAETLVGLGFLYKGIIDKKNKK